MLASPLLKELEPAARDRVLSAASERRVGRGDVLFHQDEPADALHMVAEGRIRLAQVTADGQEIVVRLCGPGEVFAGIAALDGKTYPFTAAAAEAGVVLVWRRDTLRELFRTTPRLEANVLEIVGGHAREMLDRFREMATESVPRRIARVLVRLVPAGTEAPAVLGVTQQDLAAMAGTTLYTVNRVLSEWEGTGIVRTGRGRVEVVSIDRVQALAEDR